MNALIPPTVALVEADAEAVVIGSMLVSPEAVPMLMPELRPEYFADPGTRLFFEAIDRLYRAGHKISGTALLAGASPSAEGGGVTRSAVLAAMAKQAMPLPYLSAYVATLRDRWARRALVREADVLQQAATAIDADPFDVAAATIGELDNLAAAENAAAVGSLHDATTALFNGIVDREQHADFVTTGIRRLDERIGGYAPRKVYVVAGRPGMGKSAFGCSSLRRTAEAGHGVAFFSLEMDAEEIAARCVADAMDSTRAPFFGSILRGEFPLDWEQALADAHAAFRGLPFHIDATPLLTMSAIASRARKVKAAFEAKGKRLAVVAIDHLGLVTPSDRYRGNKVAEAGEVSRGAKILAKHLDCAVLLLSQLSRQVEGREDKRPGLADLRWSGDIEQDADVVGFLFRPAYYLSQNPDADPDELDAARNVLDLLIRKNRQGEDGDLRLWCSIGHSAIRDAAP